MKSAKDSESIIPEKHLDNEIPPQHPNGDIQKAHTVHRGFQPNGRIAKTIRKVTRKGIHIVKDSESKVNPLQQSINKNDTADTGAESIRLAYTSVHRARTTIRTTQTSIRTTKSTIRLANDAVKSTAKKIRKTATASYKAVRKIVQVGITLTTHVIAVAMNPVVWILAGFALFLYLLMSALGLLLGAGAAQQQQTQEAYGNPAGLEDIPENLRLAVDYYRIACEEQKAEFSDMIESFYFDIENLSYSDLVYLQRNEPPMAWATSLATPARKAQITGAWSVILPEAEALSIVYIDLQRQKNLENDTEMEIYEVAFQQEQFNALLDVCAIHTDTLYYDQECPSQNCCVHIDLQPNPDYTTYCQMRDQYANAYNAWNDIVNLMETANSMSYPASDFYWDANVIPAVNQWQIDHQLAAPSNWSDNNGHTFLSTLGSQYEYYVNLVNSTPENIETTYLTCDHHHTLHSVGLNFFDADAVMTQYGFTENEKAWEKMVCSSISAYLSTTP